MNGSRIKYVAFHRNVNLGQRGNPTRLQLEEAYLQAGADTAASFLTNGTLVFTLPEAVLIDTVRERAGAILRQSCGLAEPAFVYTFDHLASQVAENPFREFENKAKIERSVAFFASIPGEDLPASLESPKKDCLVFRIDPGMAFAIRWQVHHGLGYPTPVLEKALGRPVTTRNWNTILRLVGKFC